MTGETTIVALCIVVITAVIAWYFKLFEKEEDDFGFDNTDEGDEQKSWIASHSTTICNRYFDGGPAEEDASADSRGGERLRRVPRHRQSASLLSH